jgi:nicotinate-nucleotide pyrophosphorylase (carboxylating)
MLETTARHWNMTASDLHPYIAQQVAMALGEDIASGDLTAGVIPEHTPASATVVARERAVLCGAEWFDTCFRQLDAAVSIEWNAHDGQEISAGEVLCLIKGDARAMLSAERSALNFLQTLSATASLTRRYVDAVAATNAVIVDTRKTVPGLRLAQKYAVRTGGGSNHRIGLFDGMLIKENHILAAGSIGAVLQKAVQIAPAGVMVQIEVENLQQLLQALAAGAKMILLDNFSPDQVREAVRLTGGRAKLEASGGITLTNVREMALTGVDRISIGAITKNVQAVDLSMRFFVG